ncbi:hypothetical protein RUM43_015070, partial [Polyplax serrata]
ESTQYSREWDEGQSIEVSPPPPTPQEIWDCGTRSGNWNVIIPCSLRGARESGQLERISTSPGGQSTRSIEPLPFMFRKVCELKGLMSDTSRLSEVDRRISGVPNDQDQDNVVEPMSLQPRKSEMGCSMGLLGLGTCIHGEFLRVQLR